MGHIIYLRYGSISFECNINSGEAIVDVCVYCPGASFDGCILAWGYCWCVYIVLGLVLVCVYCPGAIIGVYIVLGLLSVCVCVYIFLG